MSDFTSKDHKGLMEAYASIYNNQPEQIIEEQVDLEVYSENVEVDPDFLVDVIVEHLITEGYTKTENQALDIIPHISDAWLDNIIESIVIKEHFLDCMNSLVEEGYDLSSYTWDELYEEYIDHLTNQLNEVTALAPALSTPAGAAAALGGLALGALGKVKQASDYLRTSRQWGYGDPASKRWLETGSYASKKETPKQQRDTAQQRRQQAAERLRQRQQAQPAKPQAPAQPAQPSGGTSSEPPKGPDWKKTFMDSLFKKGQKKPPSPLIQQAQQKAVELAGTVARKTAKGALGLGIGGIVDQGLLGGIGGKVTRDVTRFGRGIGPGYEKLKREIKGEPETPKPEAPKQRKLKFGPDGSVIGFEEQP